MKNRLMVVGLVLAVTLTARADFSLYGTDQMTVNTDLSSSTGYLFDQSQADIVSGGYLNSLVAYDSSTATVSGGTSGGLEAYGSSTATVSGGSVNYFYAYDSSITTVSGGTVNQLAALGSNTATVSGGSVNYLYAYESSITTVSGGTVDQLAALGSNTATVSGGSVNYLYAYESSTVTFHATDFIYGSGLTLDGNRVLGTGVLSGRWFDGTPWSVNIQWNDPPATILAIPEPMTLGMLVVGGLGMMIRRRS